MSRAALDASPSWAGEPSACIKMLRVCVMAAAMHGLPPESALLSLGVSAELLSDPAARLPHDLGMRAWTEIPGRLGHPTFGLAAAEMAASAAFDVVDHALAHCATMREVIEGLMRYQRLLHDANDVRIEPVGDSEVRLSQRFRLPGPMPDHLSDFIAAVWVLRSGVLAGDKPPLLRVELTRHLPADMAEHRRIFGAPIAFGAERNSLFFESTYLEKRLSHADPSLSPVLRRHADDLLSALPASSSLATALHRHLLRTLDSGLPNIAVAAAALGVSTRSLQRRLEEEGTSFKGVLDDVRRTLAESYLKSGARTVSEVAFLVGFSEVSAFSRAFRRWTGKSAVSYRRASP